MSKLPSFQDCVFECWENPDFMRQYRRLSGHELRLELREPLEHLIDAATGYEAPVLEDEEVTQFFEFVRDHVWLPVVLGMIEKFTEK
jgi:hypothetical protein